MNLTELSRGIPVCKCGKAHRSSTEHFLVGAGVIQRLSGLCEKYSKILVVADENTLKAAGESTLAALSSRVEKTLVFRGDEILVPDERAIERIESMISDSTDLIVGIGSGVINDLSKYVSFTHRLPYYIVATAPSMDGYASVGAALILGGMKVTMNAHTPTAIIADTEVLKNAPYDMIIAGYGDVIGKYSCLNDWKLSALVNNEYFCETVYEETMRKADEVRSLAKKIASRDGDAVGSLMEALLSVGVLMAYVGNSRPASGAEHHFSHYFEIVGILKGEKYLPHGTDVFYSAAECAKIRDLLRSLDTPDGLSEKIDRVSEVERIYSSLSDEVVSLQEKVGFYKSREERLTVYAEKWDEIKEILKEAPTFREACEMLSEVGLDYSTFVEYYGEEKISDGWRYAKDLKDRYTALWTYYDIFFDN